MIPTADSSDSLLLMVSNKGLLTHLVTQLNKDFALSGLSISLENITDAQHLSNTLIKIVQHLIQTNFDGFLQLLYRVDVEESQLQSDATQNIEVISEKATFLILKREWEKVYYKNHFS